MLGRAVGAYLFFVGQAQAIFTVQVPGVARKVGAGTYAREGGALFDALEFSGSPSYLLGRNLS